MAKPKNAPALFEVIRAAQEKQRKEQERVRAQAAQLAATQARNGEAHREVQTSSHTSTPREHAAVSVLKAPLFWIGKLAKATTTPSTALPIAERKTPRETVYREVPTPAASAPTVVIDTEQERRIQYAASVEQTTNEVTTSESDDHSIPAVFIEPHRRGIERETPTPASTRAPASVSHVESTPAPVQHKSLFEDPTALMTELAAVSDEPLALSDTPARGAFRLKLDYTTGIVAGLSLLGITGLAILMLSGNGAPAPLAVNQTAPRPEVLNVRPARTVAPAQTATTPGARAREDARTLPAGIKPDDASRASASRAPAESRGVATAGTPSGATGSTTGGASANTRRVIGRHYVVVLSSPIAKDAQEAVKFLATAGISATAEQALPGYSRSWYSVITTRGFERARDNPEFDLYITQLRTALKEYQTKKFNKWEPGVYTWRAAK